MNHLYCTCKNLLQASSTSLLDIWFHILFKELNNVSKRIFRLRKHANIFINLHFHPLIIFLPPCVMIFLAFYIHQRMKIWMAWYSGFSLVKYYAFHHLYIKHFIFRKGLFTHVTAAKEYHNLLSLEINALMFLDFPHHSSNISWLCSFAFS